MQASETTLQKILTGTRVFELPFFQRRYRWDSANWEELWEDLVEQYDILSAPSDTQAVSSQGHFLGSVVLHPAPGPVSTVARYLLVDGQQRITTFMALIAAFRDYRHVQDRSWNPAAYDDLYLTNPYNLDHRQRLVPTMKDRQAYALTIHEGVPTGQVGRAYRFFLREIKRLASRDGRLDYARFENALLLRMLVVEITTTPTDDVNHIFHTLNASGEALAPLDLVRNHTFMQLGPEVETAEESYVLWQGLEQSLGEARLERYLWAQFVRTDPKASQRNLYSAYQTRLRTLAKISNEPLATVVPAELRRLSEEAPLFEAIEQPTAGDGRIPEAIVATLGELDAWGSQVHLPLTLELLSRWQNGVVHEASVVASINYILSYLVRRALCAIPTNNLNRIFASLPVLLPETFQVDESVANLLAAEQRYWPTDRQIVERATSVPLRLGARGDQVRYVLTRIESAMTDRNVAVESYQVQHVLPPALTPAWREYLAERDPVGLDEAVTKTHTLGNLALKPSGLHLGNATFDEQRDLLAVEELHVNSSITHAKEWTTYSIDARSQELAQLALAVWPRPSSVEATPLDEVSMTVEQILSTLPESGWTTVDALAEVLAQRVSTVIAVLNDAEPVLAVKVLDDDGRLPDWLPGARRDLLMTQLENSGYDAGGTIFDSPAPLSAQELSDAMKRVPGDDV